MVSLGERIAIIGPSCSGKSTLAIALENHLALKTYHLDVLRWRENGAELFDGTVAALVQEEKWIIDGCYVGVLPIQLVWASAVVYLDLSRWVCLWRYLWRGRAQLGRGGDKKNWKPINAAMIKWIAWEFPRQKKPRIDALIQQTNVPVYWLRSARDVRKFLAASS